MFQFLNTPNSNESGRITEVGGRLITYCRSKMRVGIKSNSLRNRVLQSFVSEILASSHNED